MAISLVLVRHGPRRREHKGHLDPLDPLAEGVAEQATQLGASLLGLGGIPTAVLSSRHRHARETAAALMRGFGQPGPDVEVAAFLTPRVEKPSPALPNHDAAACDACRAEDAADARIPWLAQACEALATMAAGAANSVVAVWVGHETRLSQIVLRFTGVRERQLEPLEAVCIEGPDVKSFLRGKATVAWRYPVRNWLEERVGDKLTSKMTVATFLASTNFIGMFEILLNRPNVFARHPSGGILIAVLPDISFLLFALAAVLFVCTVYLYDRLAMPEGFWTLKRVPEADSPDTETRELADMHGAPYFHMVRIWTHVFTPAVVASFAATAVLLFALAHWSVLLGFLILAIGGLCWFHRLRPSAYVD